MSLINLNGGLLVSCLAARARNFHLVGPKGLRDFYLGRESSILVIRKAKDMLKELTLCEKIVNKEPFIYYIKDEVICLSIEIIEVVKDSETIKKAKDFHTFCEKEYMPDSYKQVGKCINEVKECMDYLCMRAKEMESAKRKNILKVSSKTKFMNYLCKLDEETLKMMIKTRKIINEFKDHEKKYGNKEYDLLNDKINLIKKSE